MDVQTARLTIWKLDAPATAWFCFCPVGKVVLGEHNFSNRTYAVGLQTGRLIEMNGPIRLRRHGTLLSFSRNSCTLCKNFVKKMVCSALPEAKCIARWRTT